MHVHNINGKQPKQPSLYWTHNAQILELSQEEIKNHVTQNLVY